MACTFLIHRANSVRRKQECMSQTVERRRLAERLILRETQKDSYPEEYECLTEKKQLLQKSSIANLNPYLDEFGLIRVGGRLNNSSELTSNEKNPVIITGKHHISTLLARFYHEKIHHQGRHFTEGAIRTAGFWITGAKRLISKLIHDCVNCRKFRGNLMQQKMADLPPDRIEQAPPFMYVGIDTFGPWQVMSRKTRGGQACSKRWAILFTCLTIRAVHIEVVEELSSSTFINALRRFIAMRGPVKEFRSDRGTNFVGATDNVGIDALNVEDKTIQDFLLKNNTVWKFNPPNTSHMGGVWERLIGVSRRILESMLVNVQTLTHDVIATLMAEVTAIINYRPLVPVSCNPEVPDILTPMTILTHKLDTEKHEAGNIDVKDLYIHQWRRVKHLANVFWTRWRKEYLQTLQSGRKWLNDTDNLKVGDVVLIKDKDCARMDWPVGRVVEVFPSQDRKVRKLKVAISRNGKLHYYIRPIVDIVLLVTNDS